jgi:hypothetical protein
MIENFIIKDTPKGKFLFSLRNFDRNQVLLRFDSTITSTNNPIDIPESALQVGDKLYLTLENHFGNFINHSCNPNTYVKVAVNKAFLIATLPIAEGDEITFDYSLTSNEGPDTWSMNCNCSQFKCRKIISGFQTLPNEKKIASIVAGIVPKYNLK